MGVAIGIDLGTTNSAIARLDEYQKPVIIPNDMGEPITPSVICFKDGEVIVGREAKELQRAGEPDVAAFFKRQMGMPNFAFYAAGREYTPVDLSAFVLRKLKRDAEAVLGEAVTDAVITVPAYFKNPQREATIAAGRKAGLHVLQIINEPTAAAKAYGFSGAGTDKTLLVYDLGGGTFDVTLLQLTKDELKILTSEGDYELGGKDWDDRIVEYLMGRFKDEFGFDPFDDAESVSDLLVRAEEAKKKLSASTTAMVTLRSGTSTGRYEITRLQLDQMTSDLMERTYALCRKVLAQHHLSPVQIDGVLLVGGSTRMAMVRRFIEDTFGKPPMSGVNVDEAVALGAAIEAGEQIAEKKPDGQRTFSLAGRIRTVDVTNHSLGMIAVNNKGDAYINSIILAKDRQIPCVESRPYQVRATRVAETEIYMTQGESESPADVAYLGKYVVKDIPAGSSHVTVIDVEYSYNRSSTVEVRAKVRGSEKWLPISIEPLPDDIPTRFLKSPKEMIAEMATVYLTFDLSGSMSGTPLAEAKTAAKRFLHNVDLAHVAVGIAGVANSVAIFQSACNNAKSIEGAISSLQVGLGGGNSAHPFDDLKRELDRIKGNRFIVVLADGVWSDQGRAIAAAKECHKAGIEVIAIGFGGADEAFLRAIASSQENSLYTDLNNLGETFSSIAQVITETGGALSLLRAGTVEKRSFLSRFRR